MGFNIRRQYATWAQADAVAPWALSYGLKLGVDNVRPNSQYDPIQPIERAPSGPTPTPTPDGVGLGADAFEPKPDANNFQPYQNGGVPLSKGSDLKIGDKARVAMPWEKNINEPSEFIEFTRTQDGLSFGGETGQPTYGVSTGNKLLGTINGVPIFR